MNPRISRFAVSDVPLLDIHKVAQIEVAHRFLLCPVVGSTGINQPEVFPAGSLAYVPLFIESGVKGWGNRCWQRSGSRSWNYQLTRSSARASTASLPLQSFSHVLTVVEDGLVERAVSFLICIRSELSADKGSRTIDLCKSECGVKGVMSAEDNGLGNSCWDRCVHWSDLIVRADPKRSQMMRSNQLVNGNHVGNGNHPVNGNHVGNGNHTGNGTGGNYLGNGKVKSNGHLQSKDKPNSGHYLCRYNCQMTVVDKILDTGVWTRISQRESAPCREGSSATGIHCLRLRNVGFSSLVPRTSSVISQASSLYCADVMICVNRKHPLNSKPILQTL
ncbi:hypothetical protein J6590_007968 [Homalodisca vitripennis]|nr:hypothetical protein J6590_007968 [Homalodisca vitripennis]